MPKPGIYDAPFYPAHPNPSAPLLSATVWSGRGRRDPPVASHQCARAAGRVGPFLSAGVQSRCGAARVQQSTAGRTCTTGITPAIIAAFQQITYQTIAVKSGIRTKLVEMLAFCAERNIRVMIIKGAALDLAIYQEPWYVIHDVDLIFDQDQAALAPTIFAELDRYFWDLPGFEYDFYGHHDVTMNGLLAIDFAAIWAVATPIDLDGQVAWLMCPTDMLLAACINSCRKRFFRLKSLLAIATLVAHQPAPEWSLLFAAAHRYGCGAIVYTALLATEQTLGVHCRLLWHTRLASLPSGRNCSRGSLSTLPKLHFCKAPQLSPLHSGV
ncbi:MAG: nucleotidyltransferase family protein [Caldilineaceae bacterium]